MTDYRVFDDVVWPVNVEDLERRLRFASPTMADLERIGT